MHDRWTNADLASLLGEPILTRRDMLVTSLATGFALAVQPVSADTITTGGGRDLVYFAGDLASIDTISDFALYSDTIHLQAYATSYSTLSFTIAGTQTTLTLANGKKLFAGSAGTGAPGDRGDQ